MVVDGNTHYYICLEGKEEIFDADLANEELLSVLRYREGDRISLSCYEEGAGIYQVTAVGPSA